MAEKNYPSHYEPLLSSHEKKKKKNKGLVKWGLRTLMWVIFIVWIGTIFLFPLESIRNLVESLGQIVENKTVFGLTGGLFLIFSGPILVISLLAVVYVNISGDEQIQLNEKPATKHPRIRLWTFPVLVDGPFGVVSAAEFIGICAFILYIVWSIYVYVRRDISFIFQFEVPSLMKCSLMLEFSGLQLGSIGLYCLAFLFLPVARGSVLLRLIDIPFEQATRYHVWLGHLTMMLFTLHGLFFVISWAIQGRLLEELLEWKAIGVANLPGVISLAAGLLMWVTSLSPVRKKQFELFFYTHQLYIVFVVFLALHVGDFVFSMVAGAIFLFMLDRFLRFCQSRKTVDVISAKSLPCGTVELVLKKPGNLQYNALSFIFLQIRELSWLQWHPFSVSSSPLDGKNHLSILIKVLGGWTKNLHGQVLRASGTEDQEELPILARSKITASVEGPYGHEQPYHLMYENLILVAGGIGISPFFAILSDILHRTMEGVYCKPKNILVVWAIKKSDELPLLSTIDMESICPSFSDKLNLEICIYVTRESEPPLEEGKVHEAGHSTVCPVSNGGAMSALVGTGNSFWSGAYVVVSLLGFVILITLLDIFYVNRFGIKTWWYKGLLFIACMVASVVMFGGLVICLWHLWEKRKLASEGIEASEKIVQVTQKSSLQKNISTSTSISYGSRPDFGGIFGSISPRWGHVDVGVIVCGPATLQSSVAKECRSMNMKRGSLHPVFHFNSHSFDL